MVAYPIEVNGFSSEDQGLGTRCDQIDEAEKSSFWLHSDSAWPVARGYMLLPRGAHLRKVKGREVL